MKSRNKLLKMMGDTYVIVFGLEATQAFVFINMWCLALLDGRVVGREAYIVFGPEARQAFVFINTWCLTLLDGEVVEREAYTMFDPNARPTLVVKTCGVSRLA